MAITNFIPTIWSENLYQALDKQYIAVSHCNRDFEGEIKNQGSSVKICGVGEIAVSDYTKNSDMGQPQSLSDTVRELTIDQAKYFNFQIDDIDKAQATPKLMESAMSIAASALADTADRHVYFICHEHAGIHVHENVSTDPEDILDVLALARQRLYENNVSDQQEVVLEISPAVATMILKSKIALSTDNASAMESGYLGSYAGCKIFVSNNIYREDPSVSNVFNCIMRTKRAVAFAEQLSEIVAYRPERRFADAVKGLHLYGAEVVYPNEIVEITVQVN